MGRKIRSFEEYDAARAEREGKSEEEVNSTLERLIDTHPAIKNIRREAQGARKEAKRVSSIVLYGNILNPKDLFKQIEDEEAGRIRECSGKIKPELLPQARRDTLVQAVRENIDDLAKAGVYLARSHGGMLPEEERKEFYVRLVRELQHLPEKGKNRYFRMEFPELEQLPPHSLPEDEKRDVLNTVISRLARKKYLSRQNGETIRELLAAKEKPAPAAVPLTPTAAREVAGAAVLSLQGKREDSDFFQERLIELVGEEYASLLLRKNPNLLTYPAESIATKYLTTIEKVQEQIRKSEGKYRKLRKRFGIERNTGAYASLESLLKLKRELFAETKQYAADKSDENIFDIEEYKDSLLQRAGLDIDIVRAFTEGKTSHFKGENYIPKEYFRKNSVGKVERSKLDMLWEDTFNRMVKMGAITRKAKVNPLYRLNPHLDEIANPYLREYMRVTLYKDQILAQEREIKPDPALKKELDEQ